MKYMADSYSLIRECRAKRGDFEFPVNINVDLIRDDGSACHAKVTFSNVPEFDTVVKGIDEMHCIECAIIYVNSITQNSSDPEFFYTNGDTMRVT
jgi:hypothetical protein